MEFFQEYRYILRFSIDIFSYAGPSEILGSDRKQNTTYTSARVFVLRIRVSCAFQTHCTCVEFKLRMKRESTYFETHEYSLAALKRVSTIKYAFLPLANQIVLLQRSNA